MPKQKMISRVILQNYKSLQNCDVSLMPITFLVGPNGAGKSNFVEALRFLSYAVSVSLEQALDALSGFRSIAYKGEGATSTVSFKIFYQLEDDRMGTYLVELEAPHDGPVSVAREECSVSSSKGEDWFKVCTGVVTSNQGVTPVASEEKLYLVNASGMPAFAAVYRALSSIMVYNPLPSEIRGFKPEKRYRNLDRSGSALAEMISRLKVLAPKRLARVTEYLRRINPSIVDIDAVSVDATYNLHFGVDWGDGAREDFPSQNMSDGTLRSLAVLIALFQRYPLTLTGLEEPEAGLHPAAAAVLFDSLMEGSRLGQVVVTSHSPDLLDRDDIPEDALRAVVMCNGRTIIGPVDHAGRAALREHLYTPGELLRMDQLRPEGSPTCADAR